MAGGSFQTSREIFSNPIWQDVVKFRLFFYIVGNAIYSDEGVRVGNIILQRGQYLRSYRNLRKDLEYKENKAIKMYSLSSISRKIDQLVKEERLKIDDTEYGTLFTVVNYEEYQGFERYKKTEPETVLEQSGNSPGTVLEQSGNNNKKDIKVKKVKKDKLKNPPIPPATKVQYAEYVMMTEQEYTKLANEHGEAGVKELIAILDNYKGSTGKPYKDDYRAILSWVITRWKEDKDKRKGRQHGKDEAAKQFKDENELPF
jgi:hypothetical protein